MINGKNDMGRFNYTPVSDKYAEAKVTVLIVVFIVGLPLVSWLG